MGKSKRSINPKSSVSIPTQLRDFILQDIASEVYKPGERLDSERGLAERFGVSRASVRETIGILIDSGVLARTVGRGTFVAEPATRPKSRQIVILISAEILDFTSGYGMVLRGAENACSKSGDTLILRVIGNEPFEFNLQQDADADGAIIIGGVRKDVAQRYRDLRVPIALVDLLERQESSETEAVRIDYASGTVLAMDRLQQLGHKHVAFIGFSGSLKYELFWQSMERLGLRYDPGCVEFLHPLELEPGVLSGLRRMQTILARGRRPTALLATNDFVALGALEALTIAGIRVPEDVSIIGYDDLKVASTPPLSTIHADLEEVGRMAVAALNRRMEGHLDEAPMVVPVQFIERGSSGPAPGASAGR